MATVDIGVTGSLTSEVAQGWRETTMQRGGPTLSRSVRQSKYLDKLLHVSPKEFLVILGGGAGMATLLESSLCVLGPVVNRSWL